MNAKELEALVRSLEGRLKAAEDRIQTDPIPALGEAVQNLSDRVDRVVAGFTAKLDEAMTRSDKMINGLGESLRHDMNGFGEALNNLREHVSEVRSELGAKFEARGPLIEALEARIAEMEPKVHATNKSAPSKRNMTDEDALVVLTGDCKELTHKEAAEKVGLTYAQVYSARGEFTFKHVHKELRDKGWKNPWVKK